MIDDFTSFEDFREHIRDFLRFLDEEHEDFLELKKRADFVEKIVYVKATLDSIRRLIETSAELLLDLKSYLDAQGLPIYSAMAKTYVSDLEKLNAKVGEIIRKIDDHWLDNVDNDELEGDEVVESD